MRDRGAISEADERVDDRARMDDDVNRVVPEAEQIVRLDQLEALVRQRRGVDRDFRAHGPGGGERLIRRHPLQLLARPASKRTARRSEHQRVDRFAVAIPEALESGRVSLSTGSSRPPPRSCAASARSPAATRLSSFASARSTPRSRAQNVAGRPAKPTTALRTTSGCARSSNSAASPPTCVSGARPSTGCEPELAATSSRSGCASMSRAPGGRSSRSRRERQRASRRHYG